MPTPAAASCCPPRSPAPAQQINPAPKTAGAASHVALDMQVGRQRLALAGALVEAAGRTAAGTQGAHTATILSHIPQYDRTHVQGCVCKPAIAGGACCPTSVGSMGLQQMTGAPAAPAPRAPVHTHDHRSVGPLSGTALVLSGFGLYSGLQVWRGATEATRHLQAVQAQASAQSQALAVVRQRFGARPDLQANAAAVARSHAALAALQADVALGLSEQRFNRCIPGGLQMLSALGVLVTSSAHLLGAGPALLHGALAGAAVQGLFVLYGVVMAAKNLVQWHQHTHSLRTPKALQGADVAYRAAHTAWVQARSLQLLHTGAAWLAVSAASLMGTAVGLGFVALPYAGALAAACTAAAGAWAMWSNSCSRFAPHLPVSNHIRRDLLTDSRGRAALYGHLAAQQQAIVAANTASHALLGPMGRLRARIEQATAPQCGSEAFMVLPRAVAARLAEGQADLPDGQHVSLCQLQAVTRYLEQERALQLAWAIETQAALEARASELAAVIEPSCPHKRRRAEEALAQGSLPYDLAGEAARLFEAETRVAHQAALRLTVVHQLLASCAVLKRSSEPMALSPTEAGPMTATQKRWLTLRFETLQLCGILRDGLSSALVAGQGAHIKANPQPTALPLGSIYPLPEAHGALIEAAAKDMETLFVHAFFNPRRIEAEMDYLLALEDSGAKAQAFQSLSPALAQTSCEAAPVASQNLPFEASAASAATCCS